MKIAARLILTYPLVFVACQDFGDSFLEKEPLYEIGGEVLGSEGTVELELNSEETLSVEGSRRFVFRRKLPRLASYEVVLKTNPAGQVCMVENASGVVGKAAVKNITVRCAYDTQWVQDAYIKASNSESSDNFGFSVALFGRTLVVGAISEDGQHSSVININGGSVANNNATDSGAVYVFELDSSGAWYQDAYLKASNNGSGDLFGLSVAIYGNIIAVGAPFEDSSQTTISNEDDAASFDNSASDSGAVYIFEKNAEGNWYQTAYLKASNGEPNDYFGVQLALYGNTLAVASAESSASTTIINDNGQPLPPDDDSASQAGAVYIFQRDGQGNWYQDAYLKASNAQSQDYFGASVSLYGTTLAVGAPGEDSATTTVIQENGHPQLPDNNAALNSGAVYIFQKDAQGNWYQDAYLKASNSETNDEFGRAVSLSGNFLAVGAPDEDGATTMVLNADNSPSHPDNDGASNCGAVYIFRRLGDGSWIQDAYLKPSNGNADDSFGFSLALFGTTLVVGSPFEDSTSNTIINANAMASSQSEGTDRGAVYVFQRDSSGQWYQDAYLKAKNSANSMQFGRSLAISGKFVAVGVPNEGAAQSFITNEDDEAPPVGGALSSGAVYIFKAFP
ncbi:MAG: FG-GAP repeat protein [Leptospiraceae bacterium]|nr:FG-GAP repeat protein [Leptospiraceae bacterium]MDW8307315.1 hypothetical protein [Leptospiraceae bacterium]